MLLLFVIAFPNIIFAVYFNISQLALSIGTYPREIFPYYQAFLLLFPLYPCTWTRFAKKFIIHHISRGKRWVAPQRCPVNAAL